MKIILFILVISSFAISSANSQIEKAKNVIYLDFGVTLTGGLSTFGVGLNYERMVSDNISVRAGVNLSLFGVSDGGDSFSGKGISFPVTVNYMTNAKNKFEVGLGGGPRINLSNSNNSVSLYPAIRLGYRYQTDEEGMVYRLGVELPANTYISIAGLGYKF